MNNFSNSNLSSHSASNFTNDNFSRVVPKYVSYITTLIFNSITCPFTVLLNILVVMAVKRRPRLQNKANIMLACLAATDALTGLAVQPSFILWKTLQLLDLKTQEIARDVHDSSIRALSVCSCLHLMLVTCERLIAIKFTVYYPYIVRKRNIKAVVISLWIFGISLEASKHILNIRIKLLIAPVIVLCILFILISYMILYLETLRHQKKIKTQQLPQEEVERFVKESKALKTTVLVVGSLLLCFLPMVFAAVITASERWYHIGLYKIIYIPPYIRTFAMFNSFLNPLIYCWRQKEMRRFVFRRLPQAMVHTT